MKPDEYFNALNNTLGYAVALSATMRKYRMTKEQVKKLSDYGGGGIH